MYKCNIVSEDRPIIYFVKFWSKVWGFLLNNFLYFALNYAQAKKLLQQNAESFRDTVSLFILIPYCK